MWIERICVWVRGLGFYEFTAGHTCTLKRHKKDHVKKILYFHKCIQYMCGGNPPSLQLSA